MKHITNLVSKEIEGPIDEQVEELVLEQVEGSIIGFITKARFELEEEGQ
jgi:hypothetical protein